VFDQHYLISFYPISFSLPMQLKVLKEFVALHDFENQILDAALR